MIHSDGDIHQFEVEAFERELIQRELALLQHYPDEQLAPLIKQVGQRLESEWGLLHLAITDDPLPAGPPRAALH